MGTKNSPGVYDCYSAALPDEPMFVLLGRDPIAAVLVKLWAAMRVGLRGANEKTAEAERCAEAMAEYAVNMGKEKEMEAVIEAFHRITGGQLVPEQAKN